MPRPSGRADAAARELVRLRAGDVLAVDAGSVPTAASEARSDAQQRGLAGAVGTQQCHDRAVGHRDA